MTEPRRAVVLPRMPSLSEAYARAFAASARAAVGTATRSMVLWRIPGRDAAAAPDVAYVANLVEVDAARLFLYNLTVGEPLHGFVPAGFVHVLAWPVTAALMTRADFPLPFLALDHVANVVEQREPLRPDEWIGIRTWAQDATPHPLGTQIEIVTEVCRHRADPGSGVIWREVATLLARGVDRTGGRGSRPAGGRGAQPAGSARHGDTAPQDEQAPTSVPFTPPDPTRHWRLDADIARRFATSSGDPWLALRARFGGRAFGHPRVTAQAMHTAALGLAGAHHIRGDAFTWQVTFDSRLSIPGDLAMRSEFDGTEYRYVAWDPATGRRHLTGLVAPR